MTERKAFNFYKSHWEQMKLLNDKQKLELFKAICEVQFLEVNIDDISFSDKTTILVWTGIKHSLSTSIGGFINKQKGLNKDVIIPLSKGLKKGGDQQEEEKGEEEEEEKEKEKVQLIYSLYPSKCPIKNSSTGKTARNKDKIKKLLQNISTDELKSIINRYISECKESKTYIKNFGTFLNNIPDYSEEKEIPKETLYNYHAEGYGMQYNRTKKQMDHDRAICQGRISQITEVTQ